MKNIFLVINKEKVYAYIVSILTVIMLFFMSQVLNEKPDLYQETSTNIEVNNINNTEKNDLISTNIISE